jgi:tetratricopeptide (TPR) repeat protein
VAAALATHFERGRDNSRAIHYLLQAAEVAESRHANAVAEEHYSHVMPLAEGLPPEEKQRVRLTSLYRRGSLRLSSGHLPEAHTDFAEMFAQARVFGDAAQEGAALLALAEVHFHAHRLPEMGVQAEQALQIAGRIGNQALRAEALANLGRRHQGAGDLEKAKHLYGESIFIAQSIEHHKALTIGLTFRGIVHFFQTEYLQAERILTDASNLAAGLRDGINRQMSLFFLGLTQGNLGRLSDGLSTLNQTREISLRNGNQITLAKIENSIGWIYRELQDFESMLEHDRASVELARKEHTAEAEANAWINLIYDYTHRGDSEKTREALREVETVRGDQWHRWRFFVFVCRQLPRNTGYRKTIWNKRPATPERCWRIPLITVFLSMKPWHIRFSPRSQTQRKIRKRRNRNSWRQ